MNEVTTVDSRSQDSLPKAKNNKRLLFLLLGLLLVFVLVITYIAGKQQELPQPVPQPTPTLVSPRVDDQIIIKFKPEVSEQTINETLKKYNATIIKRIDAIHRIVIQVPKGQADVIREQMKKDNLIEEAEPDYLNQATFVPNDQSFDLQWGLKNTGQTIKGQAGTPNADINAETAWDVTRGSGVKIAVLDSGIDPDHSDLSSKIIAQKDYIGTDIDDKYGHGTHTAGIAAASTNNSAGISGTCPDCQLMIGRVLDENGSGPDSVIMQGIIWAADNGAKVINMSLGGTGNSTAKQDAIDYAWNKGVVLVASAGNKSSTQKSYPGANNNVVSVAATDNKDQKASFSTYGTWVDVTAPGKAIYSTLPTHAYNMQIDTPSLQLNYDYLNGTSMSSPMVAGVVGLIWASPYGTSASSVVQRLFDTADKISGTGTYWIYGRVNAASAVSEGTSVTPTTTITPILTQSGPTPTPIPSCGPTPISQLTPTTILTQTPPSSYPTLYCIGSCPTSTPSIIPTITENPCDQPSQSPSLVPGGSITPVPSGNIIPTTQVTPGAVPTQTPQPGTINDIFKKIIEFILKWLHLLLKLFGLR